MPEVLVIAGDFNFHLDNPSDVDAAKFSDLLATCGQVVQHVSVPTHSSVHILDLIITRSSNDVHAMEPKVTFPISDHWFIECKLSAPRLALCVKELHYRQYKKVDIDLFQNHVTFFSAAGKK